jgi:hypothetical protein
MFWASGLGRERDVAQRAGQPRANGPGQLRNRASDGTPFSGPTQHPAKMTPPQFPGYAMCRVLFAYAGRRPPDLYRQAIDLLRSCNILDHQVPFSSCLTALIEYYDNRIEHLRLVREWALDKILSTPRLHFLLPKLEAIFQRGRLSLERTFLDQVGRLVENNLVYAEKVKPTELLLCWFQLHRDCPYPTRQQRNRLASATHIPGMQIAAWFNNKRKRARRISQSQANEG